MALGLCKLLRSESLEEYASVCIVLQLCRWTVHPGVGKKHHQGFGNSKPITWLSVHECMCCEALRYLRDSLANSLQTTVANLSSEAGPPGYLWRTYLEIVHAYGALWLPTTPKRRIKPVEAKDLQPLPLVLVQPSRFLSTWCTCTEAIGQLCKRLCTTVSQNDVYMYALHFMCTCTCMHALWICLKCFSVQVTSDKFNIIIENKFSKINIQ